MEVEQSFQTPATRRSPAQFEKTTETQLDLNEQKSKGRKGKGNNENMNEELKEKNNNNEKSNSHSIVTKAFEALKPYYRDGLSNNMAWLTDDVCEDAANNLGIVMPPIGYECTMRTFRSSKDVYKDPARDNGYNYDIYNKNDTIYDENDNAIHQGTISMTEENVDSKEDINIINEFGFGYRNGYVFNEKNDITPNGLLYIKHKSEKNLFDSLNNDNSQNDNKSKAYYYYSDRRRRTDDKVGGVGDDDHEYDSIKDVTAKTTGGRISRHNGGGFHHTHLRKNIHGAAMEISDGDEEEEDNYDVINNDNDNSGNGGFAFNKPLFNETQSQRQEAQQQEEEEEDTKMNGNKPTRRSTTTVTTTNIATSTTTRTRLPSSESSTKGGGWMSRYPIFGRGSSVNDGFNVTETPIQSPAPGHNSEENRRESLVSEYSNYTPDGIQRHANRRTLKN